MTDTQSPRQHAAALDRPVQGRDFYTCDICGRAIHSKGVVGPWVHNFNDSAWYYPLSQSKFVEEDKQQVLFTTAKDRLKARLAQFDNERAYSFDSSPDSGRSLEMFMSDVGIVVNYVSSEQDFVPGADLHLENKQDVSATDAEMFTFPKRLIKRRMEEVMEQRAMEELSVLAGLPTDNNAGAGEKGFDKTASDLLFDDINEPRYSVIDLIEIMHELEERK